MADESSPGKTFQIGDVGAHARVQQGENLQWIEAGQGASPEAAELARRFSDLLGRLGADPGLDEDSRQLSLQKTEEVAKSLATVQQSPQNLKRALLDAKSWLSGKATWAWDELRAIVKSEAAQKILATVGEEGVKLAIQSLAGGG